MAGHEVHREENIFCTHFSLEMVWTFGLVFISQRIQTGFPVLVRIEPISILTFCSPLIFGNNGSSWTENWQFHLLPHADSPRETLSQYQLETILSYLFIAHVRPLQFTHTDSQTVHTFGLHVDLDSQTVTLLTCKIVALQSRQSFNFGTFKVRY